MPIIPINQGNNTLPLISILKGIIIEALPKDVKNQYNLLVETH